MRCALAARVDIGAGYDASPCERAGRLDRAAAPICYSQGLLIQGGWYRTIVNTPVSPVIDCFPENVPGEPSPASLCVRPIDAASEEIKMPRCIKIRLITELVDGVPVRVSSLLDYVGRTLRSKRKRTRGCTLNR